MTPRLTWRTIKPALYDRERRASYGLYRSGVRLAGVRPVEGGGWPWAVYGNDELAIAWRASGEKPIGTIGKAKEAVLLYVRRRLAAKETA